MNDDQPDIDELIRARIHDAVSGVDASSSLCQAVLRRRRALRRRRLVARAGAAGAAVALVVAGGLWAWPDSGGETVPAIERGPDAQEAVGSSAVSSDQPSAEPVVSPAPAESAVPRATPEGEGAESSTVVGSVEDGYHTPKDPGWGTRSPDGSLEILNDFSDLESPGPVWTALAFAGMWHVDNEQVVTSVYDDVLPRVTVQIDTVGADDSIAVARLTIEVERVDPDTWVSPWRVVSAVGLNSCVEGRGPVEFGVHVCS